MNVSSPTNPASGVYVIVPSAFSTTVPLAGSLAEPGVTVNAFPSGSKSFDNTTMSTDSPDSVVAISLLATTSLISVFGSANTSIVTVAVSQACGTPSSQMVYVKVSVPVKPGAGV